MFNGTFSSWCFWYCSNVFVSNNSSSLVGSCWWIISSLWWSLHVVRITWYEPAHDKTYSKSCTTSEDSDQTAHPRSLIRVFADRMCLLQLPGYPKKDEREPLAYWEDVQADLSLCCSHRSYCWYCCALVHTKDPLSPCGTGTSKYLVHDLFLHDKVPSRNILFLHEFLDQCIVSLF